MLVTPAFTGLIHEKCYECELHTKFQASLGYRDPVSKQSKQTPNPVKTNKPKYCVCVAGSGGRDDTQKLFNFKAL